MSRQAEELALRFERGVAEFERFVLDCPFSDWDVVVPIEQRSVRVMAWHMAAGMRLVREWLDPMRRGEAVPGEAAEIDAYNAREMDEHAGASKVEVMEIVRHGAPATAIYLRTLTDAELSVRAPFGPGQGIEMELAQVASVGARHFEIHLAHIREALASR